MDTRKKHGFESHNEDALRNVDVSYEPRDLGARGILTFLVVLFVAGVAIHLIVWGLFEVFTWQSQRTDPRLNPLVDQKAPSVGSVLQNTPRVNVQQFPEPRLQPDDVGDMDKMRIQEETILNSKPWKDQGGAVHIPIDEAMKIVAAQGLPSRSASGATSAQGAPAGPTESGNVNLQQQGKQGAATPTQQQQQH
jgi:hypothetical protein